MVDGPRFAHSWWAAGGTSSDPGSAAAGSGRYGHPCPGTATRAQRTTTRPSTSRGGVVGRRSGAGP
ncbi:hypothetical protein [Saccharothrix syringae]|uniref:hypothetical protein n=1 Tax=Saccharothrix syringae TaxID=103733 RepID=UPI001477763F|nr:hypothetical protein [Saccharothrix syringae]